MLRCIGRTNFDGSGPPGRTSSWSCSMQTTMAAGTGEDRRRSRRASAELVEGDPPSNRRTAGALAGKAAGRLQGARTSETRPVFVIWTTLGSE